MDKDTTNTSHGGGLMLRLRGWLERSLERMHQEQGGAIALMVLAATLIILMMSLVIYDAGEVSREKLEVQNAADVAVWSQTAVEARTMNMLAFANVGKKVTFGMTSYYKALMISYAELLAITVAAATACWVANFFAAGALTELCRQITGFAAEIAYVLFEEAPDIAEFESNLNTDYFAADAESFDDYQSYMVSLAPWWSWSEGFVRGTRNGASVTSGWPVPRVLENTPGASGLTDSLPVQKPSDIRDGYMDDMCTRIYDNSAFDATAESGTSGGIFSAAGLGNALTSDLFVHTADYLVKSCIEGNHCVQSKAPLTSGWERPVIYALTPLMAAAQIRLGCEWITSNWRNAIGDAGAPYQMQTFGGDEAQWLFRSSNLMFGYRAAPGRMSDDGDRAKYGFLSSDYSSMIPILYNASGQWAVSRAEMSYQFGNSENLRPPDLWHPVLDGAAAARLGGRRVGAGGRGCHPQRRLARHLPLHRGRLGHQPDHVRGVRHRVQRSGHPAHRERHAGDGRREHARGLAMKTTPTPDKFTYALRRSLQKLGRGQGGSALTEFTMFLPVWLLLFIGIVNLGKLGWATTNTQIQAQLALWDQAVQMTSAEAELEVHMSPKTAGPDAGIKSAKGRPVYSGTNSMANNFDAVTWAGAITLGGHWGESYQRTIALDAVGITEDLEVHERPDSLYSDGVNDYPMRSLNDTIEPEVGGDGVAAVIASLIQLSGAQHAVGAGARYGVIMSEQLDNTIELSAWQDVTANARYDLLVPPAAMTGFNADRVPFALLRLLAEADENYSVMLDFGGDPGWSDQTQDSGDFSYDPDEGRDEGEEQGEEQCDSLGYSSNSKCIRCQDDYGQGTTEGTCDCRDDPDCPGDP